MRVKEAIPGGIGPESWILERSRVSNHCKLPMLSGIFPVKWFIDKFKVPNLERFVSPPSTSSDRLVGQVYAIHKIENISI